MSRGLCSGRQAWSRVWRTLQKADPQVWGGHRDTFFLRLSGLHPHAGGDQAKSKQNGGQEQPTLHQEVSCLSSLSSCPTHPRGDMTSLSLGEGPAQQGGRC